METLIEAFIFGFAACGFLLACALGAAACLGTVYGVAYSIYWAYQKLSHSVRSI